MGEIHVFEPGLQEQVEFTHVWKIRFLAVLDHTRSKVTFEFHDPSRESMHNP